MAEIVLERGFAAIVRGLHRRHAGELVEVECVVLQRRPSEVDEKRMRNARGADSRNPKPSVACTRFAHPMIAQALGLSRSNMPRVIPGIEDAVRNTCLPLVGG